MYTGITTDLKRRFEEHKNGKGGAYTGAHPPQKLVYSEKKKDRSSALKREAEIKSWSKSKKGALVKLKKFG